MFFFLRCVFWLSIVYASILSSDDWRRMPSEGREALGRAGQTALTTATQYCASRATRCLSEGARLTALIDATTTGTMPHETSDGRQVQRTGHRD